MDWENEGDSWLLRSGRRVYEIAKRAKRNSGMPDLSLSIAACAIHLMKPKNCVRKIWNGEKV